MKDRRTMSSTIQTATEATAAAVATKSTYAGSIATIGGYILQSEVIAFCGLVLALAGFVVNLFFKIREDRRQAEVHRLAIQNAKRAAEAHDKIDEIAGVMRSSRAAQECAEFAEKQ